MKHLTILLLLLWAFTASAQTEKIPFNGELLDLAGKPIRTARIYTIDAKDYALSDREGRFGLSNVGPNDTLKIVVKIKTPCDIPINDIGQARKNNQYCRKVKPIYAICPHYKRYH